MSKHFLVTRRSRGRTAFDGFHWRPAVRSLAADLLLVLALGLLVVAGAFLSYRQIFFYDLPIRGKDGLYKDGLGRADLGGEGWQRWSNAYTLIRFPGVGRAPYQLALDFHNPRTDSPRTLTITSGDREVAHISLQRGSSSLKREIPAATIEQATGDLNLTLRVEPPLHAGNRDLGIAIFGLRIRQLAAAQAPARMLWSLALGALLLVIPLRVLGTRRYLIGLLVGLVLLIEQVLLAFARIDLSLALASVSEALAIGVLFVPLLWFWSQLWDEQERPWARAAALVALDCFVLRFAGMQHPQFMVIDHMLRVHQIEQIAAGQGAQLQAKLSRQPEWGQGVTVPYSLLSYDLFVPLAGRLSSEQLLAVVEATAAALDASNVLLLWHIARRSRMDLHSSWWAAALFAVFPVAYLYFHDGSYPTIIGLWATTLALWLVTKLADRPRPWIWLLSSLAIAFSILLYVTHLAFVPLLLGAAITSAWLIGTQSLRRSTRWIALAAIAGLGLALLSFYGQRLPEMLFKTLPSYIAALRQHGSVGHDAKLLPGRLLGGPWQQLWGHYRVIGVVLAAVGVVLALRHRERWATHLIVGYAVFLVLTVLVDLRFGLWNKNMYFALPGVCLAAGPVLGLLQRRGWLGRVVVFAIFGFLLWATVDAWLLRVIWYDWSLKTL